MNLVQLTVGAIWPYPHSGGMQTILGPADEAGLDLTLAAACDRPTAKERAAMAGPLRLAILPSPPLVWIALDAGALSWDAPYAAGIASADHVAAIRRGAAQTHTISEDMRGLCMIAMLDRGRIHRLRTVSLSRVWWQALATAIADAPAALDGRAYADAIARDQARLTTAQMIANAVIVEVGGAL